MRHPVTDQVIVITGANGGFGKALAAELSARGARLALIARSEEVACIRRSSTPLMDGLLADPAGRAVWGGNSSGLWGMVPLDQAVAQTVRGIERRSQMVVAPRRLWAAALAPTLSKHAAAVISFRDRRIARAIDLSAG